MLNRGRLVAARERLPLLPRHEGAGSPRRDRSVTRRRVRTEAGQEFGQALTGERQGQTLDLQSLNEPSRFLGQLLDLGKIEELQGGLDLLGCGAQEGWGQILRGDGTLGVEQIRHKGLLQEPEVDLPGLLLVRELLGGQRVAASGPPHGLHDEIDELAQGGPLPGMVLRKAKGLLVVALQVLLEAQDGVAARVRRQIDRPLDQVARPFAEGTDRKFKRLCTPQGGVGSRN